MTAVTSSAQFLHKASEIASFYGFRPAHSVGEYLPKGVRFGKNDARTFDGVAQACVTCLAGKERDVLLCFHANQTPSDFGAIPGISNKEAGEFAISLIGAHTSIGEIVALKTILAILSDSGTNIKGVRIGSAGDRDSQARFAREMSAYLKKRAADIPDCCRESSVSNPLSLISCGDSVCASIISEGPRSTAFLSERSRVHFREVLEYLERIDMPYQLDDHMAHDSGLPRVLFSMDIEEGGVVLGARGGRYDDYVRRLTGKKDASGVKASIFFRKKGLDRSAFIFETKRKSAKVYFIKLGLEATLKGLHVLDALRKARIPVYQSFSGDRLAPQLSEAEKLAVPYLIIMGQREALQDAVIVRRVATRSQQIVAIRELPQFLRMV